MNNTASPACLYTDGLSLFGHRCPADRWDIHSQFQRAFTALGVAHRVAPDAQAKGRIERRFGLFQKRLVGPLAFEKVADYPKANALLQTQVHWHNAHQVCRTTGLTPNIAWDLAGQRKRNRHRLLPGVPLLDLHLAPYHQRKLNADYTLDFLGKTWRVTPVARKIVTVVHHPGRCFWVIPLIPTAPSGSTCWPTTASESLVRFCSNIFSGFGPLPAQQNQACIRTPLDYLPPLPSGNLGGSNLD